MTDLYNETDELANTPEMEDKHGSITGDERQSTLSSLAAELREAMPDSFVDDYLCETMGSPEAVLGITRDAFRSGRLGELEQARAEERERCNNIVLNVMRRWQHDDLLPGQVTDAVVEASREMLQVIRESREEE